jgi:Zn-dependent peptidase ImmA (M78 family)
MDKYQSPILHEAIEKAAKIERETSFRDQQDILNIPINVHRIAWKRGIRITSSLSRNAREDALLTQKDDGYLLYLKSDMSQRRERFTIAHEIGHTLFYHRKRHQIGILDKKELLTEERICNRFARALLVPPEFIHQVMPLIPSEIPWQVLSTLISTCSKFDISLPALIPRLGETYESNGMSLICLIFCLRKNRFRDTEERLRVYGSCSFGEFKNIIIPFNQSADSLNLKNTEKLFEQWRSLLKNGDRKRGGMFRLNAEGNLIRRIQNNFEWIDNFRWTEERIHLSGKKRNINKYNLLTSNVLISRDDWDEAQAYIITIIKN